ncbi:MAG: hypothetical protein R2851_07155 [Caldilineaceae bacterium]
MHYCASRAYEHKEDFHSGTAAALAGGVTTVLDMPNTQPPTATPRRSGRQSPTRRSPRCV